MNEYTLTIGQVIDQLKINEFAINQKGEAIKYADDDCLVYFDIESESNILEKRVILVSGYSQKDKWKIQTSFVAFEVAIDALVNGEIIEFYKDEHKFRFKKENEFTLSEMAQAGLTIADLIDGKWSICRK
jgi:hypothetical protein